MTRKTLFLWVLPLAANLLSIGCEDPRAHVALTDQDVATTYTAGTDWVHSTLILNPDHTLDQVVTRNDHTESRTHGSWQLTLVEGLRGGGIIIMKNYFVVQHDKLGVLAAFGEPSITRLSSGQIEIAGDPDYGIEFQSK